jgi:hypothetical protein
MISITVPIEELPTSGNLGINWSDGFVKKTSRYDTVHIALRLRHVNDHDKFLPLEELLSTLCYELAHYWYEEHTVEFHRKWKSLMGEVEENMGNKFKIPHNNPSGLETDAKTLRWLQWEKKRAWKNGVKKQRKACPKSMIATWKWKKWYWSYEKLPCASEIQGGTLLLLE